MGDASSIRPWARRRACLVVPGSSSAKLAKAATLGADEIVIDLEDAVARGMKDAGRETVVGALAGLSFGDATVSVRVNAPRTPWCHLDVLAVASAPGPLRSIVVPKVEDPGDLAFVERLLDGAEAAGVRPAPLRLQALIETATALARVEAIAGGSPRLETLIVGYADLAASLGRSDAGAADLHAWDAIRDRVLIAARAHDLQAIDGPYLGIQADAEFSAGASWARELGFDGKWAIHPSQVAPLIELFQPSPEEIARARQIVEALGTAERRAGDGAVAFEDRMLDEAVRLAAFRTLARAG
jgi:citrate lyase subunit beta/citryl-CoA lyase